MFYNIHDSLKQENIKKYIKIDKNPNIKLIKYIKNNNIKYDEIGRLRSVIIDNEDNCLMFSPPKSMSAELFTETFNFNDCVVEDYIEGTMINLYWNKHTSAWEISTKSVLGANTRFVQDNKFFNDMFYECVEYTNLQINDLDKTICWSFVMQHPENKIVNKVEHPCLYLVEHYKVGSPIVERLTSCAHLFVHSKVLFPDHSKYHNCKSFTDVALLVNKSPYYAGAVIKSGLERCRIHNAFYEYVHKLHGNTSNKQMRYIELIRNQEKLKEYLYYYPEDISKFENVHKSIIKLSLKVLDNYTNCFIYKKILFKELSPEMKPIIWCLHDLYKQKRQLSKYRITQMDVIHIMTEVVNKYVLLKLLLS